MEISAKVIAHSIVTGGHELVTFELVYPFIIHGEVMTHRMFSRNAASARAIPYNKLRQSVIDNPFIPLDYQRDHKGMQGSEYINPMFKEMMNQKWLNARNAAVRKSDEFNDKLAITLDGDHFYELDETKPTKQLANRILQPYTLMRVIVTTGVNEGLNNFFKLRLHKDAEIHILELAKEMSIALNNSEPIKLQAGEWHIPYAEELEEEFNKLKWFMDYDLMIKASTGKVARISYTTLPEEKPIASYLRIHDLMIKSEPFHASAFEHVHRSMTEEEYKNHSIKYTTNVDDQVLNIEEYGWSRNTRGSLSYRTLIENNLI